MKRLALTALAATATAACVLPATAVSAEQVPVLVEQHGTHAVWAAPDEEYAVEDLTTYWDLIPLDGMCDFDRPTLQLSNMPEVFGIQEKLRGAAAGSTTGIGKILDETFELTEYSADRQPVRVYRGTGDEYAQFRHSAPGVIESVNLRVVFRGASDDGRRLDVTLQARLRMGAEGPVLKAEVQTCHTR